MNLYSKLQERKDNPLRIGLIGAGKFAAMYLAQVPKTPGIRLVGIADLAPDNARANLARVGWSPRAAGTSGCRTSRSRRPRRCGATTDSRRSRRRSAA